MMTDDRMDALIRRLEVPSTPDPAFVTATAESLRPRVRAARVEDMTRLGRLRRDLRLGLSGRMTWPRPAAGVLVVGLMLLAALATALAIAGALDRRHDLLEDVRGAGILRVAVRPDRPQVSAPGAPRSGFDVDIATELGRRLGLRVDLVFIPVDQMAGRRDEWDVALPSSVFGSQDMATSAAYYDWPIRLIVRGDAAATTPGDLSGSVVCVMTGSGGEAWLDGRLDGTSVTPVLVPPLPRVVHRLAADEDCAAQVSDGSSDGFITAAWSDADLAARPELRAVDGPVVTEARGVIALRGERDPTGLISEIDRVIAAMRSDGTIADLSRSRFGGLDLSRPPAP